MELGFITKTTGLVRKNICVFLLLITTSVSADNILLTADYMVDPIKGKLIQNPAILISDNKIVKVGKIGEFSTPKDTKTIQLKGQTLLPGLMDMHVHLISASKDVSFLESGLQSVPRKTINSVRNARDTLMAGFTAVRDLGSGGFEIVALRQAIEVGDVLGPRIWASGPPLSITGGHCDDNYSPPEKKSKANGVADGPWAARTKVRENIKYGANTIKLCATGGVFSRGTKVGATHYSIEEMKAIVEESHRRDLIVAAHAHGTEGIKLAIKAGVDSVEHASILDKEAIKLAKKYGTYLSMDIYNADYTAEFGKANGVPEENLKKDKAIAKVQREGFSQAVKAGVKMVFGSDAAIFPHGDNAKQFLRMVQHGMTEMQAIQAATVNAAKLMKRQDIGAIKKGYLADIIAVPGNPLKDISVMQSVSFVMKDGVIYKQ